MPNLKQRESWRRGLYPRLRRMRNLQKELRELEYEMKNAGAPQLLWNLRDMSALALVTYLDLLEGWLEKALKGEGDGHEG